MTDDELLDTISEHTVHLKGAVWLRHIRYNESHFGFKNTLYDLTGPNVPRLNAKALVLGAGPGFKRFGLEDLRLILSAKKPPRVLACDGALPLLEQLDYPPDCVVSVDAHPVVANFYRRARKILSSGKTTAILATSIHRDVVNECLDAGARVEWFQPFPKQEENTRRPELNMEPYRRENIVTVNTGGNVGTTAYLMACMLFRCRPVGLMGLEFAWSDDTPYSDTQYWKELIRITSGNVPRAESLFRKIKNPRDGLWYIADPVYYYYAQTFAEIWETLPKDVQEATYNLTPQGILDAEGLKFVSAKEFMTL